MQTTLTHQAGGELLIARRKSFFFRRREIKAEGAGEREREEEAFVIINADIWEAMENSCLPYLSLSN